jgi:hypothetical protein
LLEEALVALGVTTWAMVEWEADDAMGAAAAVADADERVTRVVICTPDKDLGQCVVDPVGMRGAYEWTALHRSGRRLLGARRRGERCEPGRREQCESYRPHGAVSSKPSLPDHYRSATG